MELSKIRALVSLIAAFGAGAAAFGLFRSFSWGIYVAVAVGYSTGVCCMGCHPGFVSRCFQTGYWRHVVIIHATFVVAVVTLVRVYIYGGSYLPRWLTSSYVTMDRYTHTLNTSSLLNDAVYAGVIGLMVIEAYWVRKKFSPKEE